MLATGAMLIRNGLIVAVLATRAAVRCVIPLLLMLLVSAVLWLRAARNAEVGPRKDALHVESPFKLSAALKFGLVFLALNVAGALAQRHFGTASFYFVSMAGGLLSSASSIAAVASLMARDEIAIGVGVNGIVLSTLTSVLANIPLIHGLMPEKVLKRKIDAELMAIAAVGLVGVALNNFVFRHGG